ncbi:multicopper oxidase-domain-containing protein [Mycena haematopus]|nr:multicopper oxidase-domain-containing protein [Mycena haematopus]
MADPWPTAAADDEQAALMADAVTVDSPPRWRRPSRRKRVSAISVLAILLLPFVFLLWMTSWAAPGHVESEIQSPGSQDAFVPVLGAGARNRMCTVVNGRSPGPLIEANVHDRILVYVTNGLVEEGTVWLSARNAYSAKCRHGLPLPDTPFYDGAPGVSQCPIPPGETLLYNFTFGSWTGTTWWHGHTAMQHTDGLYGPLIVHAPDEALGHTYTAEHVLTFADVLETPAGQLLPTYMTSHSVETTPEPVPDFVTINGRGGGSHPAETHVDRRARSGADIVARSRTQLGSPVHSAREPQETHGAEDNPGYPTPLADGAEGYFEMRVETGTTTRLRLVHAGSFAPLRIAVDAHVLTIIEADGSPISSVGVRDLVLQPAQRYSVLVTREAADTRTEFWIRARMIEDKFAYMNQNMQPEARAILRYTSTSAASVSPQASPPPLPTTPPGPLRTLAGEEEWYQLPQFDEWALRPAATTAVSFPNTNIHTIPFIFSIQRTHDLNWRSFINGTSWETPPMGEAALVRDTAGVYTDPGSAGSVTIWPEDQLIATLKHGYAPWLLGVGRGRYKAAKDYEHLDTANPLRRDTFTVPSRGWAVIRIVAENPGYWAWHMMGGGFFQLAGVALPDDIKDHCRKWEA